MNYDIERHFLSFFCGFLLTCIGLATLYRNMNHEFHNIWLPLHNVNGGSRAQGYLLASCYIIGKNDQPPVHAINEIVYFDDEEDDVLLNK